MEPGGRLTPEWKTAAIAHNPVLAIRVCSPASSVSPFSETVVGRPPLSASGAATSKCRHRLHRWERDEREADANAERRGGQGVEVDRSYSAPACNR
jgi:hypothetical protein